MASLVADYSSSDNSSSNEDSDDQPSPNRTAVLCVQQERLPLPKFDADGASPVKNSVFVNPFVEAENAKEAILEKHVKMIPAKSDVTNINGKKICWMYRKGRCRFGHNCKYAHDSDLHTGAVASESDPVPDANPKGEKTDDGERGGGGVEPISCDAASKVRKKKRPGLSQTLVPGKKVLNMYKKQKTSDSPFLTNRK